MLLWAWILTFVWLSIVGEHTHHKFLWRWTYDETEKVAVNAGLLFLTIVTFVMFWTCISVWFLDGEYSILDWIRDELGIEPAEECYAADCEDYRHWNR